MIYIGTTGINGSAIYFDVYSTERQGRGVRISGIIGDGSYEGEVLVEVGRSECVTFADAWLGGQGFAEFLSRCGSDDLERALIESVRELPTLHARRCRPHGNGSSCQGMAVGEAEPVWCKGAR